MFTIKAFFSGIYAQRINSFDAVRSKFTEKKLRSLRYLHFSRLSNGWRNPMRWTKAATLVAKIFTTNFNWHKNKHDFFVLRRSARQMRYGNYGISRAFCAARTRALLRKQFSINSRWMNQHWAVMAMSGQNVAYLPPNAKAKKFESKNWWQVKTLHQNDDEEIRTRHVKSYSEPKSKDL